LSKHGNSEEALEWIGKGNVPDLLVTDVIMPGLSGPNLAARLLQHHPTLRVLYMSGYSGDDAAAHGPLWLGVPLLHKPFTAAQLAERVRIVLDAPVPRESDSVIVVAAVIQDGDRFLVTRRPEGRAPRRLLGISGGKIDPKETHAAALRREIREELDADVDVGELVLSTTHAYPEKTVSLFFYRCRIDGAPRPLIGQQMKWVSREELGSLDFPAADTELIRALVAGVHNRPPEGGRYER
jgi:A/G-specific adenine glycosylase